MMEAPVTPTPSGLEIGAARSLFEAFAVTTIGWSSYSVTPDGQRFVVNTIAEKNMNQPITVLVNWNGPL